MPDLDPLPDYTGLFDLTGKTAIVTGAGGILGRHFSAALAAHGAALALVDIDGDAIDALAAKLQAKHPAKILAIPCDLADPTAVEDMIQAAAKALGGIDIVHNNAVTKGDSLEAMFAPAESYAPETWRQHMAVNLDGAFHVMKSAGSLMLDQGRGGSIISTASIYGLLGADDRIYEGSNYMGMQINTPPSYAAAKAGLIGLTRYFAARWGSDGIRVNAIAPGGVESGQNDVFSQCYGARVPMGRMARADEIVGAVVWLASDAASYVTGQVISVDGGLTAW
jgi:NAD(P)-dependent dehydrogenase (short-subunit alcohol dehydrogenase family)